MNDIVNAAADMREAQKRYEKEMVRMADVGEKKYPTSVDSLHHWYRLKCQKETKLDRLLEAHYAARRAERTTDPAQLRLDDQAKELAEA
jgi:hypothetical protein